MPALESDPAAILDAVPVTVFRVDPDLRVTYANRRGCEQLGLTPADVVGRTCRELGMPERTFGRWADHVEEAVRTGRPGQFQYLSERDGAEHLVEYRFVPLPGDGVLAVALLNDEVRGLRNALGCQEALFRTFMDHVPAMAWMRDEPGRYVFVNRSYLDHLGLRPEDLLGRPVGEVWPAGLAEVYQANNDRALAEGRTIQVVEGVPAPDGTVRRWLSVKFPFVGADGVRFVGGVGVDVTDREAEAEERRRAEARAAEAGRLEGLAALAAGAAHDFKNLLTVIVGNSALAATAIDPVSAAADHLRRVDEAAGRAADLCEQMLAFAGRGPSRVADVDLGRVARETADLLAPTRPAGIAVRLDLDPGLPAVRADETQLRQVVQNLLANAAEAIGPAGGAVTVAVRVAGPGWVELAVTDTGPGMTAEVRARAFDPFFTTKPTGRGLGLAAVRGIVGRSGGTVEVESAVGQGTTFRVRLPAGAGGG